MRPRRERVDPTWMTRELLQEACDPTNKRNQLAHGRWWSWDTGTATISVRGGIQRKDEDQFSEHSEETISAIAEKFETLEAELYKLRSKIENRQDDHSFDGSSPPGT